MQTLNVPAISDAQTAASRCAAVFVDGARRDDLAAMEWEWLPAPRLGRCRVAQRLPAGVYPPAVGGAGALPPIGAAIDLIMDDCPEERFVGVVTSHRLDAGDGGMIWVVEAESRLAANLSRTITDRWQWQRGGTVRIEGSHVHFNGGIELAASDEAADVAGRSCRVFSGQADGLRWTVADALMYLLAVELPADVAAPDSQELTDLGGEVVLDELNVTGMTLGEALVEIAHRGGLEMRSSCDGLGIVFFQPGIQGPRHDLALAPAGSSAMAGTSNLQAGELTLGGGAAPSVLALGDAKIYESTFELKPGWTGSSEGERWRDTVRSLSADWPAKANLYRRWVLNEHGWYSDEPFGMATFHFASLGADFRFDIPRRFLPCVSTDDAGQSLGVVVEIRCGPEGEWRRWPGAAWVSPGECSVYLGGDALPGDFFHAAAAGEASVRVTAAVRADVRISARNDGDPSAPVRVIDCSRRAHFRAVLPSSVLAESPSDACDDTPVLGPIAAAMARRLNFRSHGQATLAWIDTSYLIGDLVGGIDGQGVDLSAGSTCPFVRGVKHDFVAQHTTLNIGG